MRIVCEVEVPDSDPPATDFEPSPQVATGKASPMKYRVIDLIVGIEHRYSDEIGEDRHRSYDLQEAKELLVRRTTESIETGKPINLAIIDTDNHVHMHTSVNVFS